MDYEPQEDISELSFELSEDEQRLKNAFIEKLKGYLPGREKQLEHELADALRSIIS